MDQAVERQLKDRYNCPVWKIQDKTTWSTLQSNICLDCAKKIPNNKYLILPDAMAVDDDFKTSDSVDRENIMDWISVFYPSREFASIFNHDIKCSECGKDIKGNVWFDSNNEKWNG